MSCGQDAEQCKGKADSHGQPEATAMWAAARKGGGHCDKCGGFLTREGVCRNPRCLTREAIVDHLKDLPVIERGYRVSSGFRHRGTAAEVIAYERDELGNDNGVSPVVCEALTRSGARAESVMWVTKCAADAERYAGGSGGRVEAIEMPPGSVIIGADGDDGYLVWLGALSEPAERWAMAVDTDGAAWKSTGKCPRCGRWLRGGVCNNPTCGWVDTAPPALETLPGLCPGCGRMLSVEDGEDDWCPDCEQLRRATDTLRGCDLQGRDLQAVEWQSRDLQDCNLKRANLSGSDLSWANLSGADLSQAVLRSVQLQVAILHNTNLAGANLAGANLAGANLEGADCGGRFWPGRTCGGRNLPTRIWNLSICGGLICGKPG